jgi:hypothetical protein
MMQFSENVPSMSQAGFSTAPLADKSAAIAIVDFGELYDVATDHEMVF